MEDREAATSDKGLNEDNGMRVWTRILTPVIRGALESSSPRAPSGFRLKRRSTELGCRVGFILLSGNELSVTEAVIPATSPAPGDGATLL